MSNIIHAVVTEKSLRLAENGQYTFAVSGRANKFNIASEVKRLFKVDPIRVNVINIPGKVKQRGSKSGQRSNITKAIVTIKKGQKINEFMLTENK